MAGSGRRWEDKGGTPRLRGRKAVEQRKRRLAEEPLCRLCLSKTPSVVSASVVPDHIKPLYLGGADQDDNIQCLCAECHTGKTARDMGYVVKTAFGLDGWPIE